MVMLNFLNDSKEYSEQAPKYYDGIIIVQSGITERDVACFVKWLHRYCKSTNISFLLVTSTHKSNRNTSITSIRNRKRGRPKKIVNGDAAEPHYHCMMINQSEQTDIQKVRSDVSAYMKKRQKKRKNLKQPKTMNLKSMEFVSYMGRQADHTYRGGSFDFEYFLDIRYSDNGYYHGNVYLKECEP